jgi:hypothetical protein
MKILIYLVMIQRSSVLVEVVGTVLIAVAAHREKLEEYYSQIVPVAKVVQNLLLKQSN